MNTYIVDRKVTVPIVVRGQTTVQTEWKPAVKVEAARTAKALAKARLAFPNSELRARLITGQFKQNWNTFPE